jgi:hypothetical protein
MLSERVVFHSSKAPQLSQNETRQEIPERVCAGISPKFDLEARKMKVRPMLIETLAVAGFFALGVFLRTWHLEREAVEHFDEGVYASVLWYDGSFGSAYPAREFYAPPLLSTLIQTVSLIPGAARFAPFLPAVALGSITVVSLWWLARSWFGSAAGIFIAAVVSMSDFHIVYSRMALTDVPCLLWIILAVYFGTLAVQRQSLRTAIIAGIACGVGWWTKYTGWLPLAIVFSGTILWWLWLGRKTVSAGRTAAILTTMLAVSIATFAPWWWQLQPDGGYSAVAANHASYLTGFSGWIRNMATHLAIQFQQDGFAGAVSAGVGLMTAGLYRWTTDCSTWNNNSTSRAQPPSVFLLVRFMAAGFAVAILALSIRTPLLLLCLALAGFAGMFLWPVLRRAWLQSGQAAASPSAVSHQPLMKQDRYSAPRIDPALGLCTALSWFSGMLLVTPLYHPYSRLFFPLLASIWLAAAGGISWWLESNLSVARRQQIEGLLAPRRTWAHHIVTVMITAAVGVSFLKFDENQQLDLVSADDIFHSSLFADRTSIMNAAIEAADMCVLSARGEISPPHSSAFADGATIRPEAVLPSPETMTRNSMLSAEARRRERLVVYAFGEPALLMHLNGAGVTATPVSHLNLGNPDGSPPLVPTFVIIGPNAKRTPGFWEQWMERVNQFDHIANVDYRPSIVTLQDLYSPKWLREHNEAGIQTFEVHRVR